MRLKLKLRTYPSIPIRASSNRSYMESLKTRSLSITNLTQQTRTEDRIQTFSVRRQSFTHSLTRRVYREQRHGSTTNSKRPVNRLILELPESEICCCCSLVEEKPESSRIAAFTGSRASTYLVADSSHHKQPASESAHKTSFTGSCSRTI